MPPSITSQEIPLVSQEDRSSSRHNIYSFIQQGFPGGSDGRESACNEGNPGSVPGLERFPGEESTPVFLLGEFHRQRSLAGYNPWGRKELDTTEQLTFNSNLSSQHYGPMF